MRLLDLFEAASDILYHSTDIYKASKILEKRHFQLAASAGTSAEVLHQPKGTYYYLSTTRSKRGDYTLKGYYADGVVINLNGQWLNRKYKSKPIDYWGRDWNKDEMEDRVFSREPILPLPKTATDLITAIHVLLRTDKLHSDDLRPYYLRKLLLNAKLLGIPIFVYDNPENWLLQNTSKSVDPKTLISYPEKSQPSKPWPRSSKDYLKAWRELYFKNTKDTLSSDARKILYSFQWDMYKQDRIRTLATDIHNVKSKNDQGLIKLLQIFKKLNIHTAKEYVDYLADKWDKIEKSSELLETDKDTKTYILISPTGTQYELMGRELRQFCLDNNLSYSTLQKQIQKGYGKTAGWTLKVDVGSEFKTAPSNENPLEKYYNFSNEEKFVISSFTGGGYHHWHDDVLASITSRFKTPKKLILYAGLSPEKANLKIGENILSGFQSTSLDKNIAKSFANRSDAILKLEYPKGSLGAYIDHESSRISPEMEFLLPKDQKIYVTDITKTKDGYTIFHGRPL